MSAPNFRFRFYWHGETTLTLRPGEPIELSRGGRTDEGWQSSWARLEHRGGFVLFEYGTDGVDCDGRLETYGRGTWDGQTVSDEGWPVWQYDEQRQRDHTAEAMGY